MPLSDMQQMEVKAALDYLLDFSEDPIKFAQEEKELVEAFTQDIAAEHPYYIIHECFVNPTGRFLRLASLGGKVSLGGVQNFMIEFIDSELLSTGHLLNSWDKEKILKKIPLQNYQIEFTNQKQVVTNDLPHPYELTTVSYTHLTLPTIYSV